MSLPVVIPRYSDAAYWAAQVNKAIHALQNAPADNATDQNSLAMGLPVTWSIDAGYGVGDVVISASSTWVCESNVPDKTFSDYFISNSGVISTSSLDQYIRISGVNYSPRLPEPTGSVTFDNPNGRYWRSLASSVTGTTGSSAQYFVIQTLSNADYFAGLPITIQGSGSNVTCSFGSSSYVAKMAHMRPSVTSDKFEGVTITYSSYTADNTRTAASSSVSEVQVAYPRYTDASTLNFTGSVLTLVSGSLAQSLLRSRCVVKCVNVWTGLSGGDRAPIIWEEVDTRVWARRKVQ